MITHKYHILCSVHGNSGWNLIFCTYGPLAPSPQARFRAPLDWGPASLLSVTKTLNWTIGRCLNLWQLDPWLDPRSALTGEAYIRLNKLTDAEHWYRESLRAKPDHIPAHLTYGKLLAMTVRLWFLHILACPSFKGFICSIRNPLLLMTLVVSVISVLLLPSHWR